MKKHIAILLFTTLFINNYAWCMKRQRNTTITDSNKKQCLLTTTDSFLPKEIEEKIRVDVVESFKFGNNTPQGIALVINTVRDVNRSWRNFFDSPDTIRTIISNASSIPHYRGVLANSSYLMKLSSVRNYMQQSENLIGNIKTLDDNQVKTMIGAGADINYSFALAGTQLVFPILWNTQNNYEKTKLLLELGVDQNIECNSLTPLSFAVFYRNVKMIELFLGYKPQKKHVKDAIQADSLEVLQLVLQQKNISTEEIENGKEVARQQGNDAFIRLLNEYKNNKELSNEHQK